MHEFTGLVRSGLRVWTFEGALASNEDASYRPPVRREDGTPKFVQL